MKISIRLVLIAMMVVLAVVSCAIIGSLIGQAGLQSTNDGADLLRRETVSRKQIEVGKLFSSPISVLKSVAAASKVRGTFNHNDPLSTYNDWLCSAILINDYRPVYLGTEDGLLVYPFVSGPGEPCNIKTINAANKEKGGMSYNFTANQVPFLAKPWALTGTSGFDPRGRPWYNQSRERMTWSTVYVNGEDGKETALTAATPMFSVADDRNVGVIGTDFVTSKVLGYLRNIVIAKTGKMILVETKSRNVLGSTWDESVIINTTVHDCGTHKNETCNKYSIPRLSEMREPLLKSAVAALGEEYIFSCTKNSSTTEVLCRTSYGEGRDRVFVDIAGVTDEVGLDLRLVILIPEKDFLEDVWRRSDLAAIIAAVVVSSLIGLSVLIVYFVLKPLQRVEERLLEAATFAQGDDDEDDDSMFTEVANIQEAYKKMVAELKRIRSYVPQSLLRTLDRGEEDEDETEDDMEASSSHRRSPSNGTPSNSGSMRRSETDTRSNTTHRSALGAAAAAAGARKLNTTVALSSRRVSIVVVNLKDFQDIAKNETMSHLIDLHSEALKTICHVATQQRGVFDFFSGDHFSITFNAVTNCASHVTRAAASILQIADKVKGANFGAASGQVLCGNMGTDEVKRFSMIGSAVNHAHTLERLCHVVGVNNLVNYICFETMQFEYVMQCVDVLQLPQSKAAAPIATIVSSKGDSHTAEWMYALKEGEKASAVTELNEAYARYVGDDPNAAKELLAAVPAEDQSVGAVNLRKMVNVPKDEWAGRLGTYYDVALLRNNNDHKKTE